MNYYIANGTFYEYPSHNELYHYGVPGMKWGRRKARPVVGTTRIGRKQKQPDRNSPEVKAARVAKAKKVAKVGAAVVGTALAAYGGYKLAKYVQGKRSQAAIKKASEYVNNNMLRKVGDSTFKNGTRQFNFEDGLGNQVVTRGSRGNIGKVVGQHNAKVVATGRQMYKDATSTRLDRGLAKVVNTGDTIGNTAKRAATSAGNAVKSAGNTVKTSATKARNKVLDVVNPIYEYKPGTTASKVRDYGNGIKYTESVTNYYKTKKKR